MKKLVILLTTLAISSNVFAWARPYWERPIMQDLDMEIVDARFGFVNVDKAGLILTQKDEYERPTGIEVHLSYIRANSVDNRLRQDRIIKLEVTSVEDIGCGSKRYIANLPDTSLNGPRFSVFLDDHTQRICMDLIANLWTASVRDGFGWCGTRDSTMKLYGHPESVYTPMLEK